jgi:2'-5' RNA ligase
MKYYLVAMFDKDSNEYIEQVQKNLCKKYKLFKSLPLLYITLEIIGEPDVDKLTKVISELIKPYKKFKVQLDGAECSNSSQKFAALKVENKGYIMRLARLFNDRLKLNGFDVKENSPDHDLTIALTGNLFHSKENGHNEKNSENIRFEDINRTLIVDRLELWKNVNNRKEMTVRKFQLRDY